MKKGLNNAIKKYQQSQTSLEAYQAISDFVKIIMAVPEFIEQVENEGEKIRLAQKELNADKGWNYGLKGKELKQHNERRARKSEALHQLDPMFPLQNLYSVHCGVQPKNITDNSDWLFHRFSPDEPLPEADKKEYQGFIDKLYKKILPFLNKEETPDFDFDFNKSLLYFQEKEIHISLKNDKTNAHYILEHIFKSKDLSQQFPFSEIAEDTFKETNDNWRKYYRACKDINDKVYKATKIDDFLEYSSGKTAWVKINEKYLK
ncbi:MAG TPA: hypothetical protein P5323_04045 [Candidatus Moranbacteria bacterium]|nr:hypothetical protein [Candidatus Moranbacteria bacterium]HRY28281.1 hypothetical protein [Candidatus Moranbacteria bacterium]HSA08053.1 hypothetical protein [Candidatus Moranbacteria bacterium]